LSANLIGGHIDAASKTIGRLCDLAASGKDYLCLAHRLHGSLLFFRGDLSIAHEKLQKAVTLYGRCNSKNSPSISAPTLDRPRRFSSP
jgi:hypothetical protein